MSFAEYAKLPAQLRLTCYFGFASDGSPLRTSTRSNDPRISSATMIRPSAATSNMIDELGPLPPGTTSVLISRIPVTASVGRDAIDATISLPR